MSTVLVSYNTEIGQGAKILCECRYLNVAVKHLKKLSCYQGLRKYQYDQNDKMLYFIVKFAF